MRTSGHCMSKLLPFLCQASYTAEATLLRAKQPYSTGK